MCLWCCASVVAFSPIRFAVAFVDLDDNAMPTVPRRRGGRRLSALSVRFLRPFEGKRVGTGIQSLNFYARGARRQAAAGA